MSTTGASPQAVAEQVFNVAVGVAQRGLLLGRTVVLRRAANHYGALRPRDATGVNSAVHVASNIHTIDVAERPPQHRSAIRAKRIVFALIENGSDELDGTSASRIAAITASASPLGRVC